MGVILNIISIYTAYDKKTWWRHQMITLSALLAICAGNSPVTGEFFAQRPVTRSFDVSLICASINDWVNNREAGDFRHHHAHYDRTVMKCNLLFCNTGLRYLKVSLVSQPLLSKCFDNLVTKHKQVFIQEQTKALIRLIINHHSHLLWQIDQAIQLETMYMGCGSKAHLI